MISLPLLLFSIPELRICNAGMGYTRYEKIISLADYEPAQQYLNVCFRQGKGNCGMCEKCKRTMWILDAIGKIDKFTSVFPVQQYRELRSYYLRELYRSQRDNAAMIQEAYSVLCKDLSLFVKIYAIMEERLQQYSWWQELRKLLRKRAAQHK